MNRIVWILAALLLCRGPAGAAPVGDEVVDKADRAKQQYEEGHYDEALQLYRQAQVEAPEARALNFNVGSALFKTGDFAGAATEFDAAAAAEDPKLKARSLYNLGNTHYQQQQYQQAVEAYKQALELDWQDQDTKANLELALTKQQEQPQEERESQNQQGEDRQQPQPGAQGQQQEQQDGQQQSQQERPEGQQEQQQQQGSQEQREQRQGSDGRAGQRNRMDREEAEQLLDALRDREKQAHQRRQQNTQAHRGEDW